jgi:hypothetical protein
VGTRTLNDCKINGTLYTDRSPDSNFGGLRTSGRSPMHDTNIDATVFSEGDSGRYCIASRCTIQW